MKFSWFGRQASICNASVKRSHARDSDGPRRIGGALPGTAPQSPRRPSGELVGSRLAKTAEERYQTAAGVECDLWLSVSSIWRVASSSRRRTTKAWGDSPNVRLNER